MEIGKKLRNILKIGKKSQVSAGIVTTADGHIINTYQIYQGRRIPDGVDIKSLSETEIKAYPLINDPLAQFTGVIQHSTGVPSAASFQVLWGYVKGSPEVISIFSAIVEDIISDGYYLEGGKNKKTKAEKFLRKNKFKEVLTSMLWDTLVTGNGYIWKGGIGETEIKTLIDKFPIFNADEKQVMLNEILEEIKADTKRGFVDVPSSTMKINYGLDGSINGYVQRVGSQQRIFREKEIIHFRMLKLDGKVYGFTPLVAIIPEMDTLQYIKDYARYFFEKGGVPNYIFILKGETPDTPTVLSFKKTIQQFASVSNKWKSMVLTGDIEAKEINKLDKDMEFRELARFITQVIVMEWGIPAHRLSDMLIDRGTRGATDSSEGYYRKISHLQDMLEDMTNGDLLNAFGVVLKFNRTYKQDEVREVQIEKVKTDTVEQRLALGLTTWEQAGEDLKLDEKVKTELKELWEKLEKLRMDNPELLLPGSSARKGGSQQFGQNQMNQQQMLSEGAEKRAQNMDKQSAALKKK